jgi:AcrR family transcriptional regulator
MARWEPNARERFVRAALDLFTEQGYDATTVNQIAERAGLTKTTFFRHFSDKREVLFVGQEFHSRVLADALAAAPDAATPLQAVGAALDALAATFVEERRELGARLLTVIADNGELRERAVFKHVGLVEAVTGALHKRDVPEPAASLAAELGIRAFDRAFAQWVGGKQQPDQTASDQIGGADARTLSALAHDALHELRAAAAALD